MRYKKEYMLSRNDRDIFIRTMERENPHLKRSSITREFARLKNEIGELEEREIVSIEPIEPIEPIKPDVDRDYPYKEKEEIKLPITLGQKYSIDEKQQPNYIKMMELEEIKYLGYAPTRKLLLRHGFTQMEINHLDESGKLKIQ